MLLSLLLALQLQNGAVPLDSGWTLSGNDTRIEQHQGVPAIRMNTGRAVRRDVQLENGTIEFDVELIPWRTFVYVQFRIEADGELEEIYFRPHKSGLPDAVQYNPVWRGDSYWQLWHGPGADAAPRFPFRRWMHVRLVLEGQRAALFLDGATTPILIAHLARPARAGYIGLRGFNADPGKPDTETTATFANVVVQPGRVTHAFGPPEPAPAFDAGSILRWQISPAFRHDTMALMTLPPELLAGRASWPSYPVERSGVVAIGRYLTRPRPAGGAIARLVIRSAGTRLQRLQLGYSDYVTVFVNGTPLFSGDAHYSFDRPRQEGLIGRWQSTIWLPLRDGENEVLLAVVDGFGGWALTGRLDPADGGVLVPAPDR